MHSRNSPKYKTSSALCKYGELYVLNCFISGSSFQSFTVFYEDWDFSSLLRWKTHPEAKVKFLVFLQFIGL